MLEKEKREIEEMEKQLQEIEESKKIREKHRKLKEKLEEETPKGKMKKAIRGIVGDIFK